MAEPARGGKLFLIDALSLVFRAFFAPMQMALVSPQGTPTKAVYIFLRTLRKLLKDHKPDRIAVAFDLSAPTFRDKLFQEYKANRPEFPEDLSVQLPYVRRFCAALRIPVVQKEGFEADDIIGTLAVEAVANHREVFIVSGDEDLFQLVGEHTFVLKPSRGSNEGETLIIPRTPDEIAEALVKESGKNLSEAEKEGLKRRFKKAEEERIQARLGETKLSQLNLSSVLGEMGVEPAQVVDWLALTGDTSDNIPGARPLPGKEPPVPPSGKKRSYIGPKGATDLITRFGTLENVLANFEKVEKQSYREALRDYQAEARLSQQIATIRTDVPLDVNIDELEPEAPDFSELTALCQELGFTTLLREFLEEGPPPLAAASQQAAIQATELSDPKALEKWLAALESRAPLAIALAIDGDEGYGCRLVGLGLSDGLRLSAVSLADPSSAQSMLKVLGPVLADEGRPKIIHNSKILRMALGSNHFELKGEVQDTMLYAYLLEPLTTNQTLEDVTLRRLGRRMSNSVAEAAQTTRELAALLAPLVAKAGLDKLYDEIELPLSHVLVHVETAGVRIDPAILADMGRQFEKELTDLTHEIHSLAGEPFDIDSPKRLGEILFDKLKLPGGKRLKKSGQYSTDAAVLESLGASHEVAQKIMRYRIRAKLKSTYIDALPKYINRSTGSLHSSFNQTGARTGRLSSSNPNLQNIPIDDEFGLRIRSAFVAAPGHKIIAADYSQIELRVLAHFSEDPLLIDAFVHNEDIHSRTAREIFGVLPALQTQEHRRMAKAINYGVIYGLSSFGLAAKTGTSKTEAKQYIDEYFRRYSRVKDYLESLIAEARSTGRVRTLFGRIRPMPEINSRDVQARNRSEREAMNTPLQGTAADLLKLAMVKVHTRLRREKLATRMIMTVHDELVFEAPDAEVEVARVIVQEEMEGAYLMRVPLRVDIGVGSNWKEAK